MILTKEKSAILGTKNGTGEGVACLKRWYVAHVRIHHEKKVAEYWGKWELRLLFLSSKKSINGVIAVN